MDNLISCPDCCRTVSKNALRCPNCGCPIKKEMKWYNGVFIVVGIFLCFIGIGFACAPDGTAVGTAVFFAIGLFVIFSQFCKRG